MRKSAIVAIAAVIGLALAPAGQVCEAAQPEAASIEVSDQVRAELFAARETIWRAFFNDDPAQVEALLGPELIAIQQHQERWEDRDRLVALARGIQQQDVRILRLEFPQTEIQVFGDVAVMYYTYVFETGDGQKSATDAGRGTEIFVRRDGRWIDVGWHLDSGAFVRRGETWVRLDPAPQ
ncbi:nuclear transport factor 2 family protein [Luteimonas salinilitoris]|uniref:Nuclear transport factor 2 family protein n=1 Tax=Luteimonas salinilitoris TaxID=3237697 RepID=A0ABV4HQQ4_9GAMM